MKKLITLILVLTIAQGCTSSGTIKYPWKDYYTQEIMAVKNIRGLDVEVLSDRCAWYKLTVRNNTSYTIQFSWDDSAYITASGESTRLINGNTRRIFSGRSQPNSTIAPNSFITKKFISEINVRQGWESHRCIIPGPDNQGDTARILLSFRANGRTLVQENVIKFVRVVK